MRSRSCVYLTPGLKNSQPRSKKAMRSLKIRRPNEIKLMLGRGDGLPDRQPCKTAGQPVRQPSQPDGQPIGQPVRHTVGQADGQSGGQGELQILLEASPFFTAQQKKILKYMMLENWKGYVYSEISEILEIPKKSVINALNCFQDDGIAEKKELVGFPNRWDLEVDQDALLDILKNPKKAAYYAKAKGGIPRGQRRAKRKKYGQPDGQGGGQPDGQPSGEGALLDRQKNLSIKVENGPKKDVRSANPLARISDENFQLQWPHVHRFGFTAQSLHQVFEKLEEIGRSTDLLRESLDYAQWELERGPLKDSKGQEVKSPGFLFNSLVKTGSFRRPPGYVSPAEQAEMDKVKELKRIQALKAEREELEFEIWMSDLSPDQKQEILKDHKFGPEEGYPEEFLEKRGRSGGSCPKTPPI